MIVFGVDIGLNLQVRLQGDEHRFRRSDAAAESFKIAVPFS